ncbi:MAG: hypothetical protein IKW54_04095 [Bacteroidales bacterium]|nr:hypothetical protein [Bacteroidales bacterium]
MKKLSLFLIALAILLVACKPEIEKPTVETSSIYEITGTTVNVIGIITSDGGAEVTARGVCWNIESNPTIENDHTNDGVGTGSFISNITDLIPNTTYYLRAYAENSEGISYGEEKVFTTLNVFASLPTLTTTAPTDITRTTAKSGGNITDDGGSKVTERGVCWSESQNPTIKDSRTSDGGGNGEYSSVIENLTSNTKYYIRAYARNEAGVAYGNELNFTTVDENVKTKPVVKTLNITDITKTSAVCNAEVVSDGGASVTARGVCLSVNENPTISDTCTIEGNGTGTYKSTFTDLLPNTTYYVRAYATNSEGTNYGAQKKFTTIDAYGKPTVETVSLSDIEYTSAVCVGNVTSDGGSEVTARGACWSTNPNPTMQDDHTTNGKGTGEFTSKLTDLTSNTTYYVRTYATNNNGTNYGEQQIFKTKAILSRPTIITIDVTEITTNSALGGGNITDDGNLPITAKGVCWGKSEYPTIDDGGNYTVETLEGSNLGIFTSEMLHLSINTTYYVRAYATNSEGTSYGDQKVFTTDDGSEKPTVKTTSVSEITMSSAVCGGNVTTDGGAEVTEKGVCWSTKPSPTIDDNKTIDGSGTGSYTSNLTQLSKNTTYYVRAYASNKKGISYGEERIFTTLGTTGTANGHDWVDLGLPSGKKWATCNVGATSPEEYGDYFEWATTAKETSTSTLLLDESELQLQGYIDSKGNLTSQYDAATANWGGDWRMPTEAEFRELLNRCTWTTTELNGVEGYNVKGPNGDSIFLPIHKEKYRSRNYWSSTPCTGEFGTISARTLYISADPCYYRIYTGGRSEALSVRPIIE